MAAAACGASETTQTAAAACPGASFGEAQIGGPFELTAHTGDVVTHEDFLGAPTLVYFGFTFCPDICPMSLQQMKVALDLAGPDIAAHYQPILVSVDPERDTPEKLADYVASNGFPDGLIGLTGTAEQIKAAADAYKVYFQRIDTPDSAGRYVMDHSSIIFLMGADGAPVDLFTHGTPPAKMADVLSRHIACTTTKAAADSEGAS